MTITAPPAPIDAEAATPADQRSYVIRTLGCQMNVHDSERMAGLLESAGLVAAHPGGAGTDVAADAAHADVVVINTCAVRENAATKLYGNLGRLAQVKRERPGLQIAVGGCLAQQDRESIVEKAPWVDVVFGTHNIDALPVLLERARHNEQAQVEIHESLQVFLHPPDEARERLRGVGLDLGGLQQHLHVLHRPAPARQGARPPPR
ncbi:hypothetical protein GCM10025875_17450 [Litorihabitans aurantiacus]|uniref:MTTase N-terminal domain-containing protein n=1 Tax=Litorihabitans aurantiacus TaxID=1930061 RepID=A0AA37XEI9_9MICO|nr:hypothetical protein GCM10025875_17450 [Litorihabitans aurantiacus]